MQPSVTGFVPCACGTGGRLLVVILVLAAGCSGDDRAGDEASADDPTVTVVSQNLLHGTACPDDSDRCDLPGPGRPLRRSSWPTPAAHPW